MDRDFLSSVRLENLKAGIGTIASIYFSRAPSITGKILGVDEQYLIVYVEDRVGRVQEGNIKFIIQIRWSNGFRPSFSNSVRNVTPKRKSLPCKKKTNDQESNDLKDGELPTDSMGNHIKPDGESKI